MIKRILFLLFLTINFSSAQDHAWVFFNSKENVATYLANPNTMLTDRAIARRTNQGIPIDFSDVPITPSHITTISAATGITYKAKSKWMNAVHIIGSVTDINALTGFSFVDHIEFADDSLNPSSRISNNFSANKAVHVNDKFRTEATSVVYNYGNAANQIQMFNGHKLHELNYTGSGMLIAVIDAGFPNVDVNVGFQRIRDNNQIKGGYDFVNRNTNFYTGYNHGAHVLSNIAGYIDGQFVGTAPDADFYLFITEDVSSETPVEESYWVEAAEEADRLGVDVINTSLGYISYDNPAHSYDYTTDLDGNNSFITRGAEIAFSKGMIIVNSAGNSGADSSWDGRVGMPADGPNVFSIGAVNSSGNYASFSSRGPTSDNRLKPDVVAQGQAAYIINTSGNIATTNGTSFSSPILTGGIACLWQALPTLTNAEVVQMIKESASIYATPNYNLGYGIPNLELALTNALSIAEFEKEDFKIYPNPTTSNINLIFPQGIHQATVEIYDVLGKKLFKKELLSGANEVDLSSLSKGMYFVKVKASSIAKTLKIIKE